MVTFSSVVITLLSACGGIRFDNRHGSDAHQDAFMFKWEILCSLSFVVTLVKDTGRWFAGMFCILF